MELRFHDDPEEFLDEAGPHLSEQPVLSTVMSGVASRIRDQRAAGVSWPDDVPCWFATFVDRGAVVATAMRTAPFGDYPAAPECGTAPCGPPPASPLPMSAAAAVPPPRPLLHGDEVVLGANGALPMVQVFCEEMARATGRRARVGQHTRLFELGHLVEPVAVPGRLRPARVEEQDLVTSW